MKKMLCCLITVALVAALSSTSSATVTVKWEQPPDPDGYDVAWPQFFHFGLADDWLCDLTGYVTDLHFQISYQGQSDPQNPPFILPIEPIHVSIWEDVPAGVDSDYSHPDFGKGPLWTDSFSLLDPNVAEVSPPIEFGLQDWYDPESGLLIADDHTLVSWVDIYDLGPAPFYQQAGTTYWVSLGDFLAFEPDTGSPIRVGWKTSTVQNKDAAVWWDGQGWQPLLDPSTGEKLDLAFSLTTEAVIPEPASIAVWSLIGVSCVAGLGIMRRRKLRAKTG